jgi:hypothetical protein
MRPAEAPMEEIPIPLRELLALLEADPSSDEDEGRQILKAYFDEVHQILLGPYPGTSTDPAVIDRHRLVAFLDRTTILLRRIGAGEHLFNKLMIFSAALRDMDRGVASPIFTPRNLSHSPPLSSAIWRLRAILAVALDCLVRAKVPLPEAARTVVRIPGIKLLLSGQARDDAKASVMRWRKDLRRGKVTAGVARMVWQESREKLASIDGPQGLKDEAARLMAIVRDELGR